MKPQPYNSLYSSLYSCTFMFQGSGTALSGSLQPPTLPANSTVACAVNSTCGYSIVVKQPW